MINNGLHHGSVLVHCQRGISRSSTAVLFYLMSKVGMTLKNALELCRTKRPCVEPIPAFLDQLGRYEIQCREEGLITTCCTELSAEKKDENSSGQCENQVSRKRSDVY